MRYALYVLMHGLLLAFCGCASRGNVELLESELRQQEDRYYALSHELQAVRSELEIAREEAELLRTRQVNHSGTALLPEQTRSLVRMSELGISKLFTGGLDRDDQPGDEAFAVLLNPLDDDGEVIKLPGQVDMVLLDFASNEDGEPIGRWSFSTEETREHWHAGLSQGFLFRLPWQQRPAGSKLIVHARMTTPDGRDFLASHPFQITPPSGAVPPGTQLALPPVPRERMPQQSAVVPEPMPTPDAEPKIEVAEAEPVFDLSPPPSKLVIDEVEAEPIPDLPAVTMVDDPSDSEVTEPIEEAELAPPFPVHLNALEKAKIPSEPVELPFPPMPSDSSESIGTASVQLTASNPEDGKPTASASWKPTSQRASAEESSAQ
ncbi:hypothetical protein [Thalassoroseus pseudoceratinae]|uniref:hypothetical protein n=1 Tax=Thalassoroseus pseudoceratinae TaxID=2713176 RepID=UPI00141EE67A|nr:hypothetical protein [Thalassoroseus pseudoceratinae]